MTDERDIQRHVQETVNHLGSLLSRIKTLEGALRDSRSTVQTLRKGISPTSYYIPYSSATPKTFDSIATEAVAQITKTLGE